VANLEEHNGPLSDLTDWAVHPTELEEDLDSQFDGESCEDRATFRGVRYLMDLSSIPARTQL
jgi:hypothetical protein